MVNNFAIEEDNRYRAMSLVNKPLFSVLVFVNIHFQIAIAKLFKLLLNYGAAWAIGFRIDGMH
jgi:hypothetical protein